LAITTQMTIVGNLVYDPEIKYVNSGKPVVNITIASTARVLNRSTNQWEDGEPVFMRASAWDELAENIADSFKKGNRVIAVGVLKARSYESNGVKKDVLELQIDEIGPSVRYATARPEKRGRERNASNAPASKTTDADGWAVVDDDTPF